MSSQPIRTDQFCKICSLESWLLRGSLSVGHGLRLSSTWVVQGLSKRSGVESEQGSVQMSSWLDCIKVISRYCRRMRGFTSGRIHDADTIHSNRIQQSNSPYVLLNVCRFDLQMRRSHHRNAGLLIVHSRMVILLMWCQSLLTGCATLANPAYKAMPCRSMIAYASLKFPPG
jgi:hypothetical protein